MIKLNSSVYEILGNETASLLENNLTKSIKLGNDMNKCFQYLSREFPCERKLVYLPRTENENIFTYIDPFCNYLITNSDLMIEKAGREWFEFYKKALLNGTEFNYVLTFGESIEDVSIRQGKAFNFRRGQSKYALREIVYNELFENCNSPCADLIVENLESGLKLNLSQLLPKKEICFFPAAMAPFKNVEGEKRNSFVKFEKIINLNDYSGALSMDSGEKFTFHKLKDHKIEMISYGNIVEKGGLFLLLHEIAHVWHAGEDYVGLLDRLFFCLNKRVSHEKPVERIINKFNPFEISNYLLMSEKQAWLDAYTILIFLRERGFDLEPEMSNADLIEKSNLCLDTYKKFIDSFFGNLRVKFI